MGFNFTKNGMFVNALVLFMTDCK